MTGYPVGVEVNKVIAECLDLGPDIRGGSTLGMVRTADWVGFQRDSAQVDIGS